MDSAVLRETLSTNIKRLRGLRGYTQNELAEKAGLAAQTVIKIETGSLWPSDKTLCKIAEVLNIEPYKLFVPNKNGSIFNNTDEIKSYLDKYIKEIIKDSYNEYIEEKKQIQK